MATELETLTLNLQATTKQYLDAIAKAQGLSAGMLKRIERDMEASQKRMGASWASIGRTLKGGLAGLVGGFTVGALTRGLQGAISSVAGLADEASRAGVTVEELQQLVFAGRQEGTDQAGMVGAMQKLNVEVGEALEGSGDLEQRLRGLGIPIREANGEARTTKDLFLDIADAIAGARSQQEQAVLVQQALGRGAVDILPVLKQGADKIREVMGIAQASGAVIDTDLVKRAKDFDDAWTAALDSAKAKFHGFVTTAVAGVADIVESVRNMGEGVDVRTFDDLAKQAAQFADELAAAEERVAKLQATIAKGATSGGRGGNLESQLQMAETRAANLRELLAEVQGRIGTINILMEEPLPALQRQAEELQKALAEVDKQVATRGSVAPGAGLAEASLKAQLQDTLAAIDALEKANAKMRETGARMSQMAVQRFSVPTGASGGGGTVNVRVTGPLTLNPAGIEAAVRAGNVDLRTGLIQSLDAVPASVRDLRTGLMSGFDLVTGGVASSAERITAAIGRQTGTLQSAFQKLSTTGPGIESGDVFSVAVASPRTLLANAFKGFEAGVQARTDALNAEAQVLQTGLQYKQLTDKQRSAAELRLAAIEIEQAKLQENLAKATVNLTSAMENLSSQSFNAGTTIALEWHKNAQAFGRQMALAGEAFNAFISSGRLMAGGGHVRGPGGPTSDSVPIWASAGEYVVNAKQARKYRELLESINSGSRLFKFADGGLVARANAAAQRLAGGGVVQAVPLAPRRERDAPIVNVTILANDIQSFKGSERDMARQLARMVRSADV